jgi:hypothetical protein
MYLDQHGGGKGKTAATGTFIAPFRSWIVGYVVVASRSSNEEEWTIKDIYSSDGKMRREDCEVQLINKAGETRLLKGSTLQSGYEFRSSGDLPPPATEERTDVKSLGINIEGIREFYPRSAGEGTRLLMHDKTIYIVAEPFYYIWDLLEAAGTSIGKVGNGAMTGAEPQGN